MYSSALCLLRDHQHITLVEISLDQLCVAEIGDAALNGHGNRFLFGPRLPDHLPAAKWVSGGLAGNIVFLVERWSCGVGKASA